MAFLGPELWNLGKKISMNHIKYFSRILYITSWPRWLRLLPNHHPNFMVSQVQIQGAEQKMHLFFFSTDFCTFFLCICVCNTKGDAHKQCWPPKGRGSQFYLGMEGLSSLCYTNLLIEMDQMSCHFVIKIEDILPKNW